MSLDTDEEEALLKAYREIKKAKEKAAKKANKRRR